MSRKTLYFFAFAILSGCAGRPWEADRPAPPAARPVLAPPAEAVAPAPADSARAPVIARAQPQAERAEKLMQVLLTLGIDYQRGGRSRASGFDCSGLVTHVFREAWGMQLPANARQQSEFGEPVSKDALEPGDLVFYNTLNRPFSHVGIYIGGGRFVHAPRPGAAVRVERLHTTYWTRRFDGARRLQPQV